MQIEIPYIFKDIEDEGLLVFLAFFRQVAKRYGYNDPYTFWTSDIRVITGTSKDFSYHMDKWPILHCFIERGKLGNKWSFRYYTWRDSKVLLKRAGIELDEGLKRRYLIDINTDRAKLAWAYLQGCLNNNLIAENEDGSSGIPGWFRAEFVYYGLEKEEEEV